MAADHPNNAPGVPMLMPVWLERFQIRFLNPIVKPFARFVPGFATVSHTGRTSGKKYETVVNASRTGDLLAIGLMHGKTNWVKNVLAAGEADTPSRARRRRPCDQPPRDPGGHRRRGVAPESAPHDASGWRIPRRHLDMTASWPAAPATGA
jgi:deazaflavin-dependent oxidoreductase (nitroreductase family)